MTKEFRQLVRAVLGGRLERVSLSIRRKRGGFYVEALADTGEHVFASASYAHVHHVDDKRVALAGVLLTSSRRMGEAFAMALPEDQKR
jgi:hypothetical protein